MRRMVVAALALVVSGVLAQAGGPPDRGAGGDRRARGGDRRARFMEGMRRPGGFFDRMMGGRGGPDVFDAARRFLELNEEQQAAVGKLDSQHDTEEREAIRELRKTLNQKYLALIVEILPGEEKEKFQKLFAAMTERDDALYAARKELLEVLNKISEEQGVEQRGPTGIVPNSKTDLIRRCIKLTDDQQEEARELRRAAFAAMREEMRNIQRPRDWQDAEAREEFMTAIRKAREAVDDASAKAVAALLNDEQKKAYETASAAHDVYKKKEQASNEAYEKTLVELVGEEKAKAAMQPRRFFPPGGMRRPMGGDRRRPGGDDGGRRQPARRPQRGDF